MVGRRAEVGALRLELDDAIDGRGRTVFLSGASGVGKSRIIGALTDEALARKMTVATGRASAIEASIPYGVLGDALMPVLGRLDEGALVALSHGVVGDLRAILPNIPDRRGEGEWLAAGDPDLKGRLLWNFAQFLRRFATRKPLLLVLENGQWFDPSSIELIHFLGRQIAGSSMLLVVSYSSDEAKASSAIHSTERSLCARGEAVARTVEPLTRHDIAEVLQRVFSLPTTSATDLAETLHRRTLGNAFFLEEMLKSMLSAGSPRCVDGRWIDWDVDAASLPNSVREALRVRLQALGEAPLRVASVAAVVGGSVALTLLERVSQLHGNAFVDAIETLCARGVFVESEQYDDARCAFAHPLVESTVRNELSKARLRALHISVADALESLYGATAMSHAAEIATHLVRANALGVDERSIRYLIAAGRNALERRSDREAALWLGEALRLVDGGASPHCITERELLALLEAYALAKTRSGDSQSVELWRAALDRAVAAGDHLASARIHRRIALLHASSGDSRRALQAFAAGEDAASRAGDEAFALRIRVAAAMIHQNTGRIEEGIATLLEVLPRATVLQNAALLTRVHGALSQLYAWTGPIELARSHAGDALRAYQESGELDASWSAHWAMAILDGLTGNSLGAESHRREAQRLADDLQSPMLQALTAEIAIEYASAVGDWVEGLALAERTIPIARAISPRTLLPRLLVWTGLIVLARDDEARAKALFDEAWDLAGAGANSPSASEGERALEQLGSSAFGAVHNVILAHTGMAAYHVSLGDWRRALEYGLQGLALADRHSFSLWAIHRLLPLIAEASLYVQDFARVEVIIARLRAQASAFHHPLAAAWANAAEALVMRLRDQSPHAAAMLLRAADELDAVPFVFHAARLRRNAAQLYEADGNTEEALRQLRRAHDVFVRLGAEQELRGTRSQMRSLGVRLPPRNISEGAGALTGRKLEIARLVARRMTNKEIARALDISSRTVSTHLSNIFEKLRVDTRAMLADMLRDDPRFTLDS